MSNAVLHAYKFEYANFVVFLSRRRLLPTEAPRPIGSSPKKRRRLQAGSLEVLWRVWVASGERRAEPDGGPSPRAVASGSRPGARTPGGEAAADVNAAAEIASTVGSARSGDPASRVPVNRPAMAPSVRTACNAKIPSSCEPSIRALPCVHASCIPSARGASRIRT